MCGIIGYNGKENAVPIILEGLKKLEYRGYDSAGIAVFTDSGFDIVKIHAGVLKPRSKKIRPADRSASGIPDGPLTANRQTKTPTRISAIRIKSRSSTTA